MKKRPNCILSESLWDRLRTLWNWTKEITEEQLLSQTEMLGVMFLIKQAEQKSMQPDRIKCDMLKAKYIK